MKNKKKFKKNSNQNNFLKLSVFQNQNLNLKKNVHYLAKVLQK